MFKPQSHPDPFTRNICVFNITGPKPDLFSNLSGFHEKDVANVQEDNIFVSDDEEAL